jgi:hypothetical protein
MSEMILEEEGSGYRFSWGLAFAGGIVAMAVTFLLLTLGSGVGLLLVNPASESSAHGFLTAGAIYFLAAQAFGFTVGGHLAGRLLGPMPETTVQEEVRAAAHGLVAWAVAVIGTIVLVAFCGAALSGLYGVVEREAPAPSVLAYEVDKLFRPTWNTAANPVVAPQPAAGATEPQDQSAAMLPASTGFTRAARAEATEIVGAALEREGAMPREDRERLATLIAQASGVSMRDAGLRVDTVLARFRAQETQAAGQALRQARTISLWIAASLLFGAAAAMVAAAMARFEDDRQSPWSLFAFHRDWR